LQYIFANAEPKDYMQSLQDADELDKNDFRHSAYPMKMKKTLEVLLLYQLRQFPDPTSQFDDNDEIQDEEDDIQPRIERILLDIHMVPSRLELELRMVDLSSQTLLSTRRMWGEQMRFKPLASGGIFGEVKEKDQGWDNFDLKTNSEPLMNKLRMNPSLSNSMQLYGRVDSIIERRRKGKESL
jgi:hypothetical protein